ncbi:unnamed protein product [Lymnaea stagnalis]|uniref:C-type lectin domain-containing protein n=1 Tax=Lymnaea stagnalis TaxID=6523 RepID=A0AAV2HQL3_LYMST
MIFIFHTVVLTLSTWMESIEGANMSMKFTKIAPQHCGPRRLTSAWVARSRSLCATSCLVRFPNCHGFMYNNVTKLCTPSSGLSAEQLRPSLDEGDLYFSDSCQSYPDFSIKSNLSTHVNVAYYNSPLLNYTNARAACECMNSHQYVADSLEKYWLMYSLVSVQFRVQAGLNDMAVEGQFVWEDSGQEINSTLKDAILKLGQPADWVSEDCAYLHPNQTKFMVGLCSGARAYLCEKPVCY